MSHECMTYEKIITFEELYKSLYKCKNGTSWKASVQSFILNDVEKILRLEEALENGTYEQKDFIVRVIHEKKTREIHSIHFVDRVYQRSLNDNAVYPQVARSLIPENCACQIGKGTDPARALLLKQIRDFINKNGTDGYFVQTDAVGYYPNMSHKAVGNMFKKQLAIDIFEHVLEILDKYPGNKGYGAGSQMIQIAGIGLLNEPDHYIKERLHVKWYIRYMDDSIAIFKTREEAENYLKKVEELYAEKGCALHFDRKQIFKLKKGITFLGFDYKITNSGKVLMMVNRKTLRRNKYKFRKMVKLNNPDDPRVLSGEKKRVTKEAIERYKQSILAHIDKGNSYNIVQEMKAYFAKFEAEVKENEKKFAERRKDDGIPECEC